jgi:Kef-type K+ transport system membrane component KefB
MAFTDDADLEMDDDLPEYDEGPPPEESNNRTFLIILLVGVAAIVLTLVCMIAFFLTRGSQSRNERETQIAAINAQNTAVAQAISQTAVAQAWTPTPSITPLPSTATLTPTSVIALPTSTATSPQQSATVDPRTATVEALLTQSASGALGTPTPTGLPDTGFMDNVGATGLIAAAAVLVLVIILARRLRATS